jgi:tetratricopeptide (TPR) repeat protein
MLFVCTQAQQQLGMDKKPGDCYSTYRNKGIAAYNAGNYAKAKEYFAGALNNCVSSEAPANNDIDRWIKKCEEEIIEAERLAREQREQESEYNRSINQAQAYYNNKNYTSAKSEYNKALRLIPATGASDKRDYVTRRISECDRQIQAEEDRRIAAENERKRKEETEKENAKQQRFANYHRFEKYAGNYEIVQRKSGGRWGFIRRSDGTEEASTFNYKGANTIALKSGYVALKRDDGSWDVFNASLRIVASSVNTLDEYKK